ncbi:MAG TPA: aldo/keto reductase [Oceanobacillus sp.]|nr:aldo/keto reductase [Oceanobacillus sp.]
MQYGEIPGIPKPISRVVQGTIMIHSGALEQSFALLDEVLAAGGNTFDTARVYNRGDSEVALGRWIRERGVRDQVVVISKGAHPRDGRKRVTPEDITADIMTSLENLGLDFIDVYLLHRDDPDVPVGPIVEVLNEHQKAGRIGVFGGSNWSHERIAEANAYAEQCGLSPFALSSPNFSLAEWAKEPWPGCITLSGQHNRAARDWYTQTQLPVFTWSSLAGGFFSGRFTPDNLNTFNDPMDRVCVDSYCFDENFKRLDRVKTLAQQKGVSFAQVALAYVLKQPMNIFALVGSRTGEEFRANAAALDVSLTPEECTWLESGD